MNFDFQSRHQSADRSCGVCRDRDHRRGLRILQCRGGGAPPYPGGELERRLVHALRVRGDQLYRQPALCRIRGGGLLARRLCSRSRCWSAATACRRRRGTSRRDAELRVAVPGAGAGHPARTQSDINTRGKTASPRRSRTRTMRIVDLSRELYHRTPSYPGQPPIIHGVWKTHEEAFVEFRQRPRQQGDVLSPCPITAARTSMRRAISAMTRHADQRISAGELHRAGHLPRPAAYCAARPRSRRPTWKPR